MATFDGGGDGESADVGTSVGGVGVLLFLVKKTTHSTTDMISKITMHATKDGVMHFLPPLCVLLRCSSTLAFAFSTIAFCFA